MAQRRRGNSGRSGGGGLKGGLMAGFMILVIAGFAFGWAKANNITGLGGVMEYFRTWSKQVEDCGVGNLEWNCSTPMPGYEGKPLNDLLNTKDTDEPVVIPEPDAINAALQAIPTAEPEEVDYVRSDWKHWSDTDRDGCDTREEALKLSGTNVEVDPGNCKILSGTWIEPYGLKEITNSSKIDIDHIVPLSYAAANGGQKLSKEDKEAFANDPLNLFISDPSENRSKGDKGLSKYLPPNEAFQCEYTVTFISVIQKYNLSMSEAEKNAAAEVVRERC